MEADAAELMQLPFMPIGPMPAADERPIPEAKPPAPPCGEHDEFMGTHEFIEL